MRAVCLVILLLMSSECLAQPTLAPPTKAELRAACNLEGEVSGTITQFEYTNFWPDHCPGIAFGVARCSSREICQAQFKLFVEDPDTHEKSARVWIRVQKTEEWMGTYLIITSLRPFETS